MSFSERLKQLKKNSSHSVFAKKIGVSEALLRKYLNGSDPSLSKAAQIADKTGCSLTWLGGKEDSPVPAKPATLDLSKLEIATQCVNETNEEKALNLTSNQCAKLTVTIYQYVSDFKESKPEKSDIKNFILHLSETYIPKPFENVGFSGS